MKSEQDTSVVFFLIQLITNERREMRELTEWKENKTLRLTAVCSFYSVHAFPLFVHYIITE